jgi:hypothetical protein
MNAAAAAANDASFTCERIFSHWSRFVIPQPTAFNASKPTTTTTAAATMTHCHRMYRKKETNGQTEEGWTT